MNKFLFPLLIISLIACCIEVDISVPSFPSMAGHFAVSDGMIQLTIAYNFLGFCLAGIFYGPLSECFGRRRVMIVGNALLMIGAIACVFAPSIYLLHLARFIQGVGASTSAVVVFAIIADAYPSDGKDASKGMRLIGVMNSVLTILIAFAPVIGGFINQAVGWRGNYSIVAGVCVISWVLIVTMLPETKKKIETFNLKKVMKDYKTLFTSYKFMSSSLVPSLGFSAYISFVACGPFLYMETFGLTTIAYALHQGCIVGAFSVVSFFSGKIIERFGMRECIINGAGLSVVSLFGLLAVSIFAPNSPYMMTSLMALFCMGYAICYTVIFGSSLEIFPGIKGTASSAIMSMRMCLGSGFVALTGYLYNGDPLMPCLVAFVAVSLMVFFTVGVLRFPQFVKKQAQA